MVFCNMSEGVWLRLWSNHPQYEKLVDLVDAHLFRIYLGEN